MLVGGRGREGEMRATNKSPRERVRDGEKIGEGGNREMERRWRRGVLK